MESDLRETRNIYAVGRNYVAHAAELGNQVPSEPVIFGKTPASLNRGPKALLPGSLGPIHFELELVLRIGKDIPMGSQPQWFWVSHMALGIDFTARDLQARLKASSLPWHRAKNFHHASYVSGLVSSFPKDRAITFQLLQNGVPRQNGNTDLMIFDCLQLLGTINRTLNLEAGDLVFTGTPSGVGPVEHGDHLTMTCADLGLDCNLDIEIASDGA